MQPEQLKKYLTIAVAVMLGLPVLFWIGASTGSGSKTPFILFGGICALTIALTMRSSIWLLIPICWELKGKLGGVPGELPLSNLVILYVFVVVFFLKALKVIRSKIEYCWLDYLLIANIVYLITAFIRHPAGTNSMGLERVGGRPYFDIAVAMLGYWVLGHISINAKQAFKLPLYMLPASLVSSVLSAISVYIPSLFPVISKIYTGVSAVDYRQSISGDSSDSIQRSFYLGGVGEKISSILCCYFSPTSLLHPFHFFRFVCFSIAIVATVKSGFRSALLTIILTFIFSLWIRDGFSRLFKLSFFVLPLMAVALAAHGTLFELPLGIQRSLSFLPGHWDYRAADNAQGTVEWRVDLWKKVWDSHAHYIDDWWLGDGFGFNKQILNEVYQLGVNPSPEKSLEGFILTANYHSLPLSTIGAVGFVGLGLFFVLEIGMAAYGWRLATKCRQTPWFPAAVLIGVKMIYSPIIGFLVYGHFGSVLPESIFLISMARLIERSHRKEQEENQSQTSDLPETFPSLSQAPFTSKTFPVHL